MYDGSEKPGSYTMKAYDLQNPPNGHFSIIDGAFVESDGTVEGKSKEDVLFDGGVILFENSCSLMLGRGVDAPAEMAYDSFNNPPDVRIDAEIADGDTDEDLGISSRAVQLSFHTSGNLIASFPPNTPGSDASNGDRILHAPMLLSNVPESPNMKQLNSQNGFATTLRPGQTLIVQNMDPDRGKRHIILRAFRETHDAERIYLVKSNVECVPGESEEDLAQRVHSIIYPKNSEAQE